jgi:hypothetical protein
MGLFFLGALVSTNPVTGDRIVTKPSKKYEDNYDAIFRKDADMKSKKKMPGKGGKGKKGC